MKKQMIKISKLFTLGIFVVAVLLGCLNLNSTLVSAQTSANAIKSFITAKVGESVSLPGSVSLLDNNVMKSESVVWTDTEIDTSLPGIYLVDGVTESGAKAQVEVAISNDSSSYEFCFDYLTQNACSAVDFSQTNGLLNTKADSNSSEELQEIASLDWSNPCRQMLFCNRYIDDSGISRFYEIEISDQVDLAVVSVSAISYKGGNNRTINIIEEDGSSCCGGALSLNGTSNASFSINPKTVTATLKSGKYYIECNRSLFICAIDIKVYSFGDLSKAKVNVSSEDSVSVEDFDSLNKENLVAFENQVGDFVSLQNLTSGSYKPVNFELVYRGASIRLTGDAAIRFCFKIVASEGVDLNKLFDCDGLIKIKGVATALSAMTPVEKDIENYVIENNEVYFNIVVVNVPKEHYKTGVWVNASIYSSNQKLMETTNDTGTCKSIYNVASAVLKDCSNVQTGKYQTERNGKFYPYSSSILDVLFKMVETA